MARPSKYNKQVAEDIIHGVKEGLSREDAARLVGIHPATLYTWIKAKPDFAEELYKADSFAVEIATSALKKAVEGGNFKAALAWLQAKRPLEWGQRQRIDIANPPGETFQQASVDLSQLSTAEIMSLISTAEKLNAKNETTPGDS